MVSLAAVDQTSHQSAITCLPQRTPAAPAARCRSGAGGRSWRSAPAARSPAGPGAPPARQTPARPGERNRRVRQCAHVSGRVQQQGCQARCRGRCTATCRTLCQASSAMPKPPHTCSEDRRGATRMPAFSTSLVKKRSWRAISSHRLIWLAYLRGGEARHGRGVQ